MSKSREYDNVGYTTSSQWEPISLVMQSLLPKIELNKFSLDKGDYLISENDTFPIHELIAIRESLKSICLNKSHNLKVEFNTLGFSPIYSDIIAYFGEADCTLSLKAALSTILSGLPLDKHEMRIYTDIWEPVEIVNVLKNWKDGKGNIKHLKVRERDHYTQRPWKWEEICSALNIKPITGKGYRKVCHERFELHRECDYKILDVTYYKYGCTVDLEEI